MKDSIYTRTLKLTEAAWNELKDYVSFHDYLLSCEYCLGYFVPETGEGLFDDNADFCSEKCKKDYYIESKYA